MKHFLCNKGKGFLKIQAVRIIRTAWIFYLETV